MNNITLESLIEEQHLRIGKLRACDYYPYYDYDEGDSLLYQEWVVNAIRLINIRFPNDKHVREFEEVSNLDLSPRQQARLLAILESFEKLPTIVPTEKHSTHKEKETVSIQINNSNSQTQSQEQSLAINIFFEAIKDELTGKQVKELKEVIAESAGDKEKARRGIVEKLKSFGSDVVSNIVANIITNPSIWQSVI